METLKLQRQMKRAGQLIGAGKAMGDDNNRSMPADRGDDSFREIIRKTLDSAVLQLVRSYTQDTPQLTLQLYIVAVGENPPDGQNAIG